MASPQCEDGYTKTANELLDFLCRFRIPGEARQVFDAIKRKTYGYSKKMDWISSSQLIKMTQMPKGNVSRGLAKLKEHRLVIASDNMIGINKDYDQWIEFGGNHFNPKLSQAITKVIVKATRVIVSDNKKLSQARDTKEKKENIQKKIESTINNFKNAVDSEIDNLQDKFKTKSVMMEYEKAQDWLRSSGKTKKDYLAFFRNWLRNSKDTRIPPRIWKPPVDVPINQEGIDRVKKLKNKLLGDIGGI